MRSLVFASTLLLSAISVADEVYLCTHGESQRVISVTYASEQNRVPCEVKYTKADSEVVLWRAQNLVGYCEEKAREFVAKQQAWGWTCTVTESQQSEETPASE